MDLSIKPITPEALEDRGAEAYDAGLGENDHGLHPNWPARKHWQYGYHRQRVIREQVRKLAEAGQP